MAKKRLSQNQQEFQKQSDRITKFINRATKRGFRFTDLPFDVDKSGRPIKPKRITKPYLKKLEEFTQKTAYQYAEYTIPPPTTEAAQAVYYDLDIEYDRVISGIEGRELERKISARKGLYTKLGISDNEETSTIIQQGEQVYIAAHEILTNTFYNYKQINRPSFRGLRYKEQEIAIKLLERKKAEDEIGLYMRLANASEEVITEAQGICFSSEQGTNAENERQYHLNNFIELINGSALDAKFMQSLTGEYYDTM